MCKIWRTLALCGLLVIALSVPVLADHAETDIPYAVTGGNIWFDEATGVITDCDEGVTEAIIPLAINDIPVKEIGRSAFGIYSLRRVILPDTIQRISYQAFYYCYNLDAVTIPGSVTQMAEEIFMYSVVPHVTFLDGISKISGYTFYDCKNLRSITLPVSIKEIAGYAFYGCSDLTDIYYAGTPELWQTIEISDNGNESLDNVLIHYGSTGPESPGTTEPPTVTISTPTFGASIPLSVTGSGTRSVNFITGFYSQNHRFIAMEIAQATVYPGLQSVFVPVNQWSFTPVLKVFALDDSLKPLPGVTEQNANNSKTLSDKYTAILSESDTNTRDALVDALTEQEAKAFIKQFADWFN